MSPTKSETFTAKEWPLLLQRAHRPFFLLTALYGALAICLWILSWRGIGNFDVLWHGHEMIFGFAAAGLAGFMLTAIPNWTKQLPVTGLFLAVLLGLWLAGRLAMGFSVLEWVDLLFLPCLGAKALLDIVRARNHRNLIVPGLIFGLTGLNTAFHFGDAMQALHLSVFLIIAMVTLIAGRIAPLFTMIKLGIKDEPPLMRGAREFITKISVPLILLVAIAQWYQPSGLIVGWAALVAAIFLTGLMLTWHGYRSLREPLLWIMHAGFIWVPVGLFLKALHDIWDIGSASAVFHALTAGAIGVMLIAVSSRAAMGHSGRPLEASRSLVIAYVLVLLAALVRVFVPGGGGIDASGTLWVFGFALYAIVLWPVLVRPREDGKPG